jgi:hypothetical protein
MMNQSLSSHLIIKKNTDNFENKIVDLIDGYQINNIGDINIEDNTYNSIYCNLIEFAEEIFLVYKNKIIGNCNYWLDIDYRIPFTYKNKDNQVLSPIDMTPIYGFNIYNKDYIKSGMYYEYNYLVDHDILQKNQQIVLKWY